MNLDILYAKLFGTRVEKFYLFFDWPFSLFKKKIGDTEYGIGSSAEVMLRSLEWLMKALIRNSLKMNLRIGSLDPSRHGKDLS